MKEVELLVCLWTFIGKLKASSWRVATGHQHLRAVSWAELACTTLVGWAVI